MNLIQDSIYFLMTGQDIIPVTCTYIIIFSFFYRASSCLNGHLAFLLFFFFFSITYVREALASLINHLFLWRKRDFCSSKKMVKFDLGFIYYLTPQNYFFYSYSQYRLTVFGFWRNYLFLCESFWDSVVMMFSRAH